MLITDSNVWSSTSVAETPHIAIIDDDASVRDALATLLDVLGYVVATHSSVDDFIRSDTLTETSCIIADMHMTGMSGLDLAQMLGEGEVGLPIILITAFPQEPVRQAALRNGALAYLSKPIREETLLALLEQAVGPPH